jgi:hypothetical protein
MILQRPQKNGLRARVFVGVGKVWPDRMPPNPVPEKCAACGKSFEALAAEMRKGGGNLMKAYKGQSSCCKRGGLKGHLKEVDWAAYRSS